MIFRQNDIIVLDFDYLNGDMNETTVFDVERNKWSNPVRLQIMDTRGNHSMITIPITLPAEPKVKNPEDVDDIPESVDSKGKITLLWATIKRI